MTSRELELLFEYIEEASFMASASVLSAGYRQAKQTKERVKNELIQLVRRREDDWGHE